MNLPAPYILFLSYTMAALSIPPDHEYRFYLCKFKGLYTECAPIQEVYDFTQHEVPTVIVPVKSWIPASFDSLVVKSKLLLNGTTTLQK